MNKKLNAHVLPLLSLIVLTILMCRNLILSPAFPAGMDILAPISGISYLTNNFEIFSIWISQGFGVIMHFSLYTLLATMNLFFHDPSLVIKIFIFATLLLSGASMYFFVYYYTKKRVSSIFSAVAFMLSQFYFGQLTSGHLNILFTYAMGPLLFLTFDKAIQSGELKLMITFSAITSIFVVFIRMDMLVYYVPFLLLLALFCVALPSDEEKRITVVIRLMKVVALSTIFVFLFCAFQLLPLIFGVRAPPSSLKMHYPIEVPTGLSRTFYESLLGMPSEIYLARPKSMYFPLLTPFLYYLMMSILVVLALSAVFLRTNKQTLFFTLSALISVFLAKGPHWPLGDVFLWFYINVPYADHLRVPNRWLMTTCLSYAFLAGVTVDTMYVKLQNLSLKSQYNWLKKIRYIPQIFLILIIIPTFLCNWYVTFYGLPTWSPPKDYVYPYLWIAERPGDFRVTNVPYGQGWMDTGPEWGDDILFSLDLGYASSVFHQKPVIGVPLEGDSYENDFIRYTQGLLSTSATENLMKILGAFNVKYLVVQGYSSTHQRFFFSRQNGLQQVYVYENSTVFENEYWTPHVFAVSKYAVVVGGREAFTALTTVDTLDFSNWGLLFADQVVDQLGIDQLLELLKEAHLLIFVNSEPLDLAMLTLEDAIKIRATDYAYPSTNASKYWINEGKWTSMGTSAQNRYLLSTSGNLSVSMPIKVEESGQYDLWIRLLYAPDRGNLSITIDGTTVGSTVSHSTQYYSGLKWVKIGSIRLQQGRYELVLTNEWALGKCNDVDEILLVQPQHLESAINQLTTLLQTSPIRIMNIIEGEQMFKWVTTPQSYAWWPTKWPLLFDASGGYVASTAEETAWMPLTLFIPRNGTYGIAVRATSELNGTLNLLINKHIRQVELTPLEIRGINLTTIIDDNQTTFWENQAPEDVILTNDKDNRISGDDSLKIIANNPRSIQSVLEKNYDPMEDWNKDKYITFWFKGAGSNATFSVYIYFDGSPDNYAVYNFVDTFTAWRRLVFPLYDFAAAGGTIDWSKVWRIKFAIEDRNATGIFQIDCMARAHEFEVEEGFDWVALQALALEATNNTIELCTNNGVDLDQMVIYSLNPSEENVTLEDIFKIDQKQTTVSYKKINPTQYIAHVKIETPFLLVFSDAYHNLWKAHVNGEEIRSIPAYSFINAFYITETGEYDVTIEFIGQRYVVYGGIISIATIILITIYLAFNVKINRFIVKKLKLRKGNEK